VFTGNIIIVTQDRAWAQDCGMRTLFAAGASLLCSLAFQLSLQLYPTALQPYAWIVKWLWVASIILWAVWGLGHPRIRAALWGDGPTVVLAESSGFQYKTKEFWRLKSEEQTAELNKCKEGPDQCDAAKLDALEKVKDLEERLSLFTPLQIEAFRLARDIGKFELPVQPAYNRAMSNEEINSELQQHLQSNLKFSSAYSLNLAPRVKTLMHRLGEQGINANELSHFTEGIADVQQIPVLRARIVRLAHALDGVELEK
jgi:hypothetical protein